jgi:hypothetical protein
MAEKGGGGGSSRGGFVNPDGSGVRSHVEDLLQNLQLTAEEEEVAEFSDDEEEAAAEAEFALVGKVLSPSVVHVNTIRSAMKPAWGNPYGMKLRAIGEKGDNLFVVDFGDRIAMNRVLEGSPWMVGKHAVILKPFDARLRASDIKFEKMDIWARILDLPLGWMNDHKGTNAMGLLGEVKKMDVNADGKAEGAFLRARVAIDLNKPLKRGVLLRMSRKEEPKWFSVQYERLPFFCFACGLMGHTERDCGVPVQRNDKGLLPYDLPLRASEDRKKRFQSFAEAAADSFGSGPSTGTRSTRASSAANTCQPRKGSDGKNMCTGVNPRGEVEPGEEANSPAKHNKGKGDACPSETPTAAKQLFDTGKFDDMSQVRKRKSKSANFSTPDLNNPVTDGPQALVPVGLVNDRVSKLVNESDDVTKKQKMSETSQSARSAAAAGGGPRRAQ